MGCQNSTGLINDIEAKNSNLILGYWGFPLRGQPLRYILELANYPYTETKYTLSQLTNQQYLYGEGQDKYRVDNIRFVCDELTSKIFSSTLQKDEEKKNQLNTQILPKIKQLQKVLGSQTQFFKKLTLADIYAYTTLNYFKKTYPQEYKQFAFGFDPFLKRFEEIPRIQTYHQSQRYDKL
ncbi:hypothetical protein ABPG73_021245 [Tetrahymena malaccensis]